MKAILWLCMATLLLAPLYGQAAINSSEALGLCKENISDRTDGSVYHKFKMNPATSTRGGVLTLWIDSTMKNEQRKFLLKSKCIVSKSGELIDLEIEEGRW